MCARYPHSHSHPGTLTIFRSVQTLEWSELEARNMSLSFWGHVCMCVSPIARVSVCTPACVYLCEGKRAFVFEVCGHRSMSVSIGRSFGRALGISIFSVALFLDARKKANNKNATEIASVCVWKCVHVCCLCLLYCSEVTDWRTDGLNGWPTDCQTDDIFDQQWHKVTCNTFCWGSDKQRLREWGSTSKDFRGLSLLT